MLCSLLLAAAAAVGGPPSGVTAPAPSPYSVIAQGLVELDEGSYAWSYTAHDLTASELAIGTEGPAILLARGDGSAVLTEADGTGALLGNGEAQFSDAGVSWTAIALAESGGGAADPATRLDVIAVVPGAPGDASLSLGAGLHDFELRSFELAAGETLSPQSDTPAFAVVVGGSLIDANGQIVETGGTTTLAGGTLLAAEQPATVVVAAIAPLLNGPPVATTTTIAATAADTTATTGPAVPTTTTTTTTAPAIDLDGDGLTDNEEAALGTDHNDPDSDDDTLSDGDEVNTYGTDPLSIDTDGDELPDAGEVITYGSDPLDTDTDDDGLLDIEPVNWGTGPTNPDTDDDGLLDGQEVNDFQTNPHNTDSDGDSLTDGDEVNNWGSDPTDTDSDGDTLVDGEEVNGTHTDPANDDSDDDGVDDGTEAGNGTDPNDANDP